MLNCVPISEMYEIFKEKQESLIEAALNSNEKVFKPFFNVVKTPCSLVESSKCYYRNLKRETSPPFSVSITPADDRQGGHFQFYEIFQWVGLVREPIGSIQIFEETGKISVRLVSWSNMHYREFTKSELTTLLDILEKAQAPIDKNLLMDFQSKEHLSECYWQKKKRD